jgi:hypothetical protein
MDRYDAVVRAGRWRRLTDAWKEKGVTLVAGPRRLHRPDGRLG